MSKHLDSNWQSMVPRMRRRRRRALAQVVKMQERMKMKMKMLCLLRRRRRRALAQMMKTQKRMKWIRHCSPTWVEMLGQEHSKMTWQSLRCKALGKSTQ